MGWEDANPEQGSQQTPPLDWCHWLQTAGRACRHPMASLAWLGAVGTPNVTCSTHPVAAYAVADAAAACPSPPPPSPALPAGGPARCLSPQPRLCRQGALQLCGHRVCVLRRRGQAPQAQGCAGWVCCCWCRCWPRRALLSARGRSAAVLLGCRCCWVAGPLPAAACRPAAMLPLLAAS